MRQRIRMFGMVGMMGLTLIAVAAGLWTSATVRAAPTHAAVALMPHRATFGFTSRVPLLPHRTANLNMPNASYATPPGNFPFQVARSADGKVIVHYYNQPTSYGAGILGMVEQALRQYIQPTLGYTLVRPINLYVYNSTADLQAGTGIPSGFSAYADPVTSSAYMQDFYDNTTLGSICFVVTDLDFSERENAGHLELDYSLYPNWLIGGLNEAVQDLPAGSPYATYDDSALLQGLLGGTFIDIFTRYLWVEPSDPTANSLYVAEARAFIQYLLRTYGPAKFHTFIADVAAGDANFAAIAAFGVDLQTLHSNWNVSLGQPALHHATGGVPPVPSPVPIFPHLMPARATSLTPYSPAGGDSWLATSLLLAAIGAIVALLGLLASWLVVALRRRTTATGERPIPAPAAAVPAPPNSATTSSPFGSPAEAPGWSAPVAVAVATPEATPPPRRLPTLPRLLELVALAVLVPLAMGLALLWTQLDPAHSWRGEYLVAGALGALAGAGAVVLLVLAWRARRVLVAHAVTPLVLFALAVVALVSASPAGVAEGKAYLHDEAFALAYATLQQSGASNGQLADAQFQWAQAAAAYMDSADALLHFRAALALGLGPRESDAQAAAYTLTLSWGDALVQAQRYAEAAQTYAAELSLASCDASCQVAVKKAEGTAYLAWASDLIAAGNLPEAGARLQYVQQHLTGTQAASSASTVLGHLSASLGDALSIGHAGDATAMDLLLELIAVQHPGTVEANEAAAASQPVTGSINPSELYGATEHMYFLGFASQAAAQTFTAHFDTDTSLFKILAETDASGNFSVLLPAGYWYAAIWEAAPQNGSFAYFYLSNQPFTVKPFTPLVLSSPLTY